MNAETKMAWRLLEVILPQQQNALESIPEVVQESTRQFDLTGPDPVAWLVLADFLPAHGIRELSSPLSD
ncbi:MAG TPA: hypothetical protein VN578_21035 [Candidatus Binatia bacterium]|jgi:hypothetical protein|nr:hypothetical protein [Candidatus Binatia bacterium]